MNVDRSRFLLLAAALSANACTIIDNRGQTDASAGGDDSAAVDTGAAIDSFVADSAVADSAVADGVATDGSSDVSDAPICTDEGIVVPACSSADAGADAGGCTLDGLPACTQIPANFKPRAAKAAIDCLLKLPTCEGTTTDPVWDCAIKGLEAACPDSTVEAYCTTLAASCPAADAGADGGADAGSTLDLKAECKKLAGGLNDTGRTRLKALVVAEGGCDTPLRDLLTSL